MTELLVSFAIEKLGDQLIAEAKFLAEVSNEVEEIKAELRRMKCFLQDVDERQIKDETIRNWVAEIRDLGYRTEDVLETYTFEVASKREANDFMNTMRRFFCIYCEGKSLHEVGAEIATIRNKITNLTASLQTYGIKPLKEAESSKATMHQKQMQLRISYPHMIERDFVGMESDLDNLVSFVADNDDLDHRVILIKGMVGQGKTTIATKIYNHPHVLQNFEAFAWVCVTRECDRKKVLQDIFRELLPSRKDEIERMVDSELVRELYKVLQQKKCLVVLDDIWTITDWKTLCPALPIDDINSKSKILLTSRQLNVGFVYKLRYLTEDEGWELLKKKAFPTKKNIPDFKSKPELEDLGRQMVRHCEGLPLAIAVLGGILKDKSTSSEWEMVNKNIHSYLKRGEGVEDDNVGLAHVLAMSYDDLPYCLKQCFMYIGNFPEDHIFYVDNLGMLWIAEGLVSSEDRWEDETMMDVVERYLDELAQRSMIQITLVTSKRHVHTWSIVKKFSTCRLHDLMRDMSVSKGTEAGFFKVVDSRLRGDEFNTFMTTPSTTKTHRLAVYSNDESNVYNPNVRDEKTKHLRSLLLYNINGNKLPMEMSGIKEFKFLRVLKVEWFSFNEEDLQGIKELIHLRYLSLKCASIIKKFPSFIGDLRYLEILQLASMISDPIILPNVLWKLKRLRHLSLPPICAVKGSRKLRLDGLMALESLSSIDISVTDVNDIFRLPSLNFIDAQIFDNFEDLRNIISYMKRARHLRKSCLNIYVSATSEEWLSALSELFSCDNLQNLFLYTHINKFPAHNQDYHFSSGLTKIHLLNLNLEEDPMTTLENFPNLLDLLLNEDCYVGKEMVCSSTGFPQLQVLKLNKLPNLENWRMDKGAMPNLCVLEIWSCKELKMLPEGLIFISTLKSLKIVSMDEEFNNRIVTINGKEGEDVYKVRHVPSVVISTQLNSDV